MTEKLFFVASLILSMMSNATAMSSDFQIHNCWDGSYAYKVASVVADGSLIEIGFKSGFNLFSSASGSIEDNSGIPLENGQYDEKKIYAAFKPSQCEVVGEVMTCKASHHGFSIENTLFIGRTLYHLGDVVKVITPIRFNNLVVTISPEGVEAMIEQQTGSPEWSSFGIKFPFHYCNVDGVVGNTHFGNAYFPDELKEYLKGF